jgi:predicted RND superfamily exporter protein
MATRARLLGTGSQLLALGVCAALGFALFAFVDLTPRVESDFFFSSDDPQLEQSARIAREFGYAPQVFVAVRSGTLASRRYLIALRDLTSDLGRVEGVVDARSITHGLEKPGDIAEQDPREVFEDLDDRPFFKRLLLAPDRSATFVVLTLREDGVDATVAAIDQVLDRHDRPDFRLGASGVPYVSEHMRRRLSDELQFFSLVAFGAFALIVSLLFRSAAVVVGTMVAALTACFGTFLVRALLGMRTDILAPNLWTIAFVLTLSHVVYLAAEWRQLARRNGTRAVSESIRFVGPASMWSLAANLLGFGSLLFVSAEPLRQFGLSGVIAAVAALASAYLVFPPFLRAADPGSAAPTSAEQRASRFFTSPHPRIAAVAIVAALLLVPFAWRVTTDPSLPSYFADGDRLRSGLEAIDRSSGSSPLDVVVENTRGGRLDNGDAFDRLTALQRGLERHPDVGSVLSIALLMEETKRPWYSFLFSWDTRLDALDSDKSGRIGRTFMSRDRERGRFVLRMKEFARDRPRAHVVREIEGIVRAHGFRPAMVSGLYTLQGELSKLVEGSVIRGLAGLIALFGVIVFCVTRSIRTTVVMTSSLTLPPFAMFGIVGLFGMPVDIISAPAANVALPLGIDEMIHLGYAVRRQQAGGRDRTWAVWGEALRRLWAPILASMLIVGSGFSLFLFSGFPPTQRLGVLVCLGALLTDLVVLLILPVLATRRFLRSGSSPAGGDR